MFQIIVKAESFNIKEIKINQKIYIINTSMFFFQIFGSPFCAYKAFLNVYTHNEKSY